MSSPLVQGRIVWATVPDPRGGNAKARPAEVVTATADIDPAGEVQVAAITTLVGQAPFAETVELPWSAGGHPDTIGEEPAELNPSRVVFDPCNAQGPIARASDEAPASRTPARWRGTRDVDRGARPASRGPASRLCRR